MKASTPDEFLPLTPALFNIPLALGDGDIQGYGIIKEIEAATQGRVVMGPGPLYGAIDRLLRNNFIEESDERPDCAMDDERRRYYKLTALGARVAAAEAGR